MEVATTRTKGYKPTAEINGGEQSLDNIRRPKLGSVYAVEWPAEAESVGKMMMEVNRVLLWREGLMGKRRLGGRLSTPSLLIGVSQAWRPGEQQQKVGSAEAGV